MILEYFLWFACMVFYIRFNANGQIGNGTLEEVTVPCVLEMTDPIKYVASGANHNLAITSEYFRSTAAIDDSCSISLQVKTSFLINTFDYDHEHCHILLRERTLSSISLFLFLLLELPPFTCE